MPDHSTQKKFRDLAGQLIDDEISEAGLLELATLVKSEAEFSDELRAQLLMDSRLLQFENETHQAATFTRSVEDALDAEEDSEAFVGKVVNMTDRLQQKNPPSRPPWVIAIASLAACLLLGLYWLRAPQNEAEQMVNSAVAVVSKLIGELHHEDKIYEVGDSIGTGILELKSGYLSLEFYRGAQVMVAGPARLELIDAQRVICHFGKVRAIVPEVASGFTIVTPDSEVVDLGTEFAVVVGKLGETEIHVFEGEVEAYDSQRSLASKQSLTAGLAMKIDKQDHRQMMAAEATRFDDLTMITSLEENVQKEKFNTWQALNTKYKNDPRLIAYYDFEKDPQHERKLINRASSSEASNGAIIGAQWGNGPWPGKQSLNFKRPSDRVRISIPGEYEAITLAAWVRVDGIDRSHSSLLLTDAYDPGELHWQIRRDGTLILGIRHTKNSGTNYSSNGFMNLSRLGRWFHLSTVIDQKNRVILHYLNGELLNSRPLKNTGPIRFGGSTIGNWDEPSSGSQSAVRNLNGQFAEMMVFRVALNDSEIRQLALK